MERIVTNRVKRAIAVIRISGLSTGRPESLAAVGARSSPITTIKESISASGRIN
jgi:hypothetical protein